MKRIIASVLCIILLLGIAPAAFASDTLEVTAVPDKGKAEIGEMITVLVTLSGTEPSTSASVAVEVGEGLEVVGGEMLGNYGLQSFDVVNRKGVAASTSGAVSYDGEFAKVTVKVLEDAPQIMRLTVTLRPSETEKTIEVTLNDGSQTGGPSCYASLNLADNVDINIYVDDVTDSMIESGYYVEYSTNGGSSFTRESFDGEHVVKPGKYGFKAASFCANQLTSEVLFRICDGSGSEVKGLTYSVKEYCDYQIENSDGLLKSLCEALMAYGYYAQIRFPGTASEAISNKDYTTAIRNALTVKKADLEEYNNASADFSDPVTEVFATLVLESETKLNFYFSGIDGADDVTLFVGDDIWDDYKVEKVSTSDGGLKCRITVNGLNTVDLAKEIWLFYDYGEITYSPMAYVYYAVANRTEDANVCKALFRYVTVALDYFD
ncbi:MAG: hypothetical protein IKI03_02600 [Clostridia bacterium]|nr:hypothetical protein [Clostridia bacterium]